MKTIRYLLASALYLIAAIFAVIADAVDGESQ